MSLNMADLAPCEESWPVGSAILAVRHSTELKHGVQM